MPAPTLNFAPTGPGWRTPRGFTPGWSPGQGLPHGGYIAATEPGGGMIRRSGSSMGSFFTYPTAEGVNPQQFLDQGISTGSLPDPMSESPMFGGRAPKEGSMAWESGPAPWDIPGTAMPPGAAPGVINAMPESKVIEAAQAAQVAVDGAMAAAKAGAPKVAATHAATAQLAANCAAKSASSQKGHQIAAAAQANATKARAAANLAVTQPGGGQAPKGMGDWLSLSGMGEGGMFSSPLYWAGVGVAVFYGYKYAKARGWI